LRSPALRDKLRDEPIRRQAESSAKPNPALAGQKV
jgi:hypothetical protein